MDGGKLVARALKKAGVDCIFTLSGGHVMAIYDGCLDEGIKVVDVRHEQAAVHAAEGYARSTGKVGVVLVTSGPGATNLVTGIATAHMDSTPTSATASTVLGLGLGPLQSLFGVAIQNAVPMNRIGVVTSANQFFRQIGSTVSLIQ